MRDRLIRLWRGDVHLKSAFWDYAIIYGTLINLAATIAALAALVAGVAGPVTLAIHLLPTPYNVLVIVGVWRSAEDYKGPQKWADLARASILIWALVMTFV